MKQTEICLFLHKCFYAIKLCNRKNISFSILSICILYFKYQLYNKTQFTLIYALQKTNVQENNLAFREGMF